MSLEPDFPFLSVVLTVDTQSVGEHLQKGIISMPGSGVTGDADNNCDGVSSPAPAIVGSCWGTCLKCVCVLAHLLHLRGRESITLLCPLWGTGRAHLSDTRAIGRACQWHKYHL